LRDVSLYYVQKLIYQLNRDRRVRERFETDRESLLKEYELTQEEQDAIRTPDIGKLFVLGVNGQLLMHYAALHHYPWANYIQAMRDGVAKYGKVREGLYTMLEK